MTRQTTWARKCSEEGCGKHLRAQNKSGRCWMCNSTIAYKNYHENNKEKIRKRQRENYHEKKLEKLKWK